MSTPANHLNQTFLKPADQGLGVSFQQLKTMAEYQGDANAQFTLGMMYYNGQGIKKDFKTAAEMFRLAAGQRHREAQYYQGVMFEYGLGVTKNENTAAEWYSLAAGQGHLIAARMLGVLYHYGRGVAKDINKAFEWFRYAAENGDVEAQVKLGVLYEHGLGVTKDIKIACSWYAKAAKQGHLKALSGLEVLAHQGVDAAKEILIIEFGLTNLFSKGHTNTRAIAPATAVDGASKESEWETKETAEKIWNFDSSLKPMGENGYGYALIPAGDKDIQKVIEAYRHGPVPGYEIKSVKIIYNSALTRTFSARLQLLQERYGNAAFSPKWPKENQPEWRASINSLFENMTAPYQDKDLPGVKILPCWHGTKPEILSSLFKTGFANLASTDVGYFGKGLYSSFEPEYAYRVYSHGALLVNWLACFSAYPVIEGDMLKLTGKANYQNYDAHVVPVVPEDPSDPNPASYIPCKPGQVPTYTEVVVFESSQCLPRYLVELQTTLPKAPTTSLSRNEVNKNSLLYAFVASKTETAGKEAASKHALVHLRAAKLVPPIKSG